MRIGVLGSRKVAKGLGTAWIEAGHEVCLGSRHPNSEENLWWTQSVGVFGAVHSIARAAEFGEAILLAVNPWNQVQRVLQSVYKEVAGKALIDLSNNIEFGSMPKLAFTDRSLGQAVQEWSTDARVVKTLNHLPVEAMIRPETHGICPSIMWISGDDDRSKSVVSSLLYDPYYTCCRDVGARTTRGTPSEFVHWMVYAVRTCAPWPRLKHQLAAA